MQIHNCEMSLTYSGQNQHNKRIHIRHQYNAMPQQQQHQFNGPLSRTTQVSWYQKGKNQSGFYWSKRQWVAVESDGPYASLHLAIDRYPRRHPTTLYRPDALPATQPTASKH